jgi:transcriptional regulator
MYLPAHFSQPDDALVRQLIREAPLATLVTRSATGGIEANHLPMLLDADEEKASPAGKGAGWRLRFHVARANSLWRDARPDDEVLAIFQGPDTYISPNWYASKAEHGKVVPTWNYAVVHVYGRLAIFDDKEWLRDFLPQLTAAHEARFEKPWQVSDAPEDYLDKMRSAIVGIELAATRIVAKWKVGQNQPAANQATLLDGLRRQAQSPAGQPGAQAIADLLHEHIAGAGKG